ncbi:hypothetical protein [Methanobrevibacter sp. DSM 116169]|uniref:hypothetical protein n=1 Tax=Methanobrevibacter sp. DSM 116169 TaxID=3242727 RepID=UPI0038FC0287
MREKKQANLIIFSIVAIIALVCSSLVFSITAEFVPSLTTENTQKLIPVENDGFTPVQINSVEEEKNIIEEIFNFTSEENNTTEAETITTENYTDDNTDSIWEQWT